VSLCHCLNFDAVFGSFGVSRHVMMQTFARSKSVNDNQCRVCDCKYRLSQPLTCDIAELLLCPGGVHLFVLAFIVFVVVLCSASVSIFIRQLANVQTLCHVDPNVLEAVDVERS